MYQGDSITTFFESSYGKFAVQLIISSSWFSIYQKDVADIVIRVLIFALCLSSIACSSGVTFNRAQPPGQKSVYKMQNDIKTETSSLVVDRGSRASDIMVSALLETDVTSSQQGGSWTLSNKFTQVDAKVNGESKPDASGLPVDKPFSITMDADGKIVKVTGLENDKGANIEQVFSQLSPTAMLPNKPIKVGESWPFEITSGAQGGSSQTIKGVGTLKGLNGDEAVMEFDFIIQVGMAGNQQMNLNGIGQGKTTAVYDTDKARFVSHKSDVTIETIGNVIMGEKSEPVKNTFTSSTQVDLVKK